MSSPDAEHRAAVAAIVLAAGASRRLGFPKQLVEYRGRPLVRHAAAEALAAGASPVIVVLGAQAERVRPALDGLDVEVVLNERWSEGLSSSIRAGLESVPGGAAGILMMACDQPAVGSELLGRLIGAFSEGKGEIVACGYGGSVGIPVVFGAHLRQELAGLSGDSGAKEMILSHGDRVWMVRCPEADLDVDVAPDVRALKGRSR